MLPLYLSPNLLLIHLIISNRTAESQFGSTLPLLARAWRHALTDIEQFAHIEALSVYLNNALVPLSLSAHTSARAPRTFDDSSAEYQLSVDNAKQLIQQIFKGYGSETSYSDVKRMIGQLFQPSLSPDQGSIAFSHLAFLSFKINLADQRFAVRHDLHHLSRALVLREEYWRIQFDPLLDRMTTPLTTFNDTGSVLSVAFTSAISHTRLAFLDIRSDLEEVKILLWGCVGAGFFKALEMVAVGLAANPTGLIASSFCMSLFSFAV